MSGVSHDETLRFLSDEILNAPFAIVNNDSSSSSSLRILLNAGSLRVFAKSKQWQRCFCVLFNDCIMWLSVNEPSSSSSSSSTIATTATTTTTTVDNNRRLFTYVGHEMLKDVSLDEFPADVKKTLFVFISNTCL